MPAWMTFVGGVVLGLCVLVAVFGAFFLFFHKKRLSGKPHFGVSPGVEPGTITYWVYWDRHSFSQKFYRMRLLHVCPGCSEKEGQVTYTFDPQAAPFRQSIRLPETMMKLVADKPAKAIVAVEVRTTEEYALFHDFTLRKFRKICAGRSSWHKVGNNPLVDLPLAAPDEPVISTLSYRELLAREKRIEAMEAEAKARQEKKKPAAKPIEGVAAVRTNAEAAVDKGPSDRPAGNNP